jgi:type IV pilus assembly protein PilA
MERGFSLIEVLVVMLVIAVLAAIALPAFLGQQDKSDDADAKSNARNLVSLVEACYTGKDDYRQCASQANLGGNIGIPYGTSPGQAEVSDSQRDSFTVIAVSKAKTGGANNTFTIDRAANGVTSRTCSGSSGGCHSGSW